MEFQTGALYPSGRFSEAPIPARIDGHVSCLFASRIIETIKL
jgi:hypothetical protein